eukprot:m.616078 g.616078  ORF g.616078 m.616078 type:complete len:130 (+) comp22511_c0_seq15:432-821(+)
MMEGIASRMCRNRYGHSPHIELDGDVDVEFSYIPAHLEYILQELLKNAFRAVVERHGNNPAVPLPPVKITLCRNDVALVLRISDVGGGIAPEMLPKCWSWTFTTVGYVWCATTVDILCPTVYGTAQCWV